MIIKLFACKLALLVFLAANLAFLLTAPDLLLQQARRSALKGSPALVEALPRVLATLYATALPLVLSRRAAFKLAAVAALLLELVAVDSGNLQGELIRQTALKKGMVLALLIYLCNEPATGPRSQRPGDLSVDLSRSHESRLSQSRIL
jgi:hypothetical protein